MEGAAMLALIKRFENIIVSLLMIMMSIVVLVTTVELGWLIAKDIAASPIPFLVETQLLDIFGFFLLILIGLELIETIKIFVAERVIRVRVVLLVGVIAIARKVIILDIKNTSALSLIGVAAIILALTTGYYLIDLSRKRRSAAESKDN
jgi:uncharacterized membrane protein (DUF373 family)